MNNETRTRVHILISNHLDLIWRRCLSRRFTDNGKTYVSYEDMQRYYLLDNLDVARRHPRYAFEVEGSLVARTFLRSNPEYLDEMRKLVAEKRFAVAGTGDNIIDTNLVLGETLVRNFVYGILWAEDTLGQKTKIAQRNDAFGNPSQLPQILRGCELSVVTGLHYVPIQKPYWRGQDGSVVLCPVYAATLPSRDGIRKPGLRGYSKYPPCQTCAGVGVVSAARCPSCQGRGICAPDKGPGRIVPKDLANADAGMWPLILMHVGTEEGLPNLNPLQWDADVDERFAVRYALSDDAFDLLGPMLAKLDNPPEDQVDPRRELNPVNTGCYVTRIRTKQIGRRQEHDLLTLEPLAAMAHLKGAAYPQTALREAWYDLLTNMTHDPGTMVDPAYDELCERWNRMDDRVDAIRARVMDSLSSPDVAALSVINPLGFPATDLVTTRICGLRNGVTLTDETGLPAQAQEATYNEATDTTTLTFLPNAIPAWGVARYTVTETHAREPAFKPSTDRFIENESFRIAADDNGLTGIFDLRLNRDISRAAIYRPLEFVYEHDHGSPWSTLSADQGRLGLAQFTNLEKVEKGKAGQRLVLAVNTRDNAGYAVNCITARLVVELRRGDDRIRVHSEVQWDTFESRLRLALPVNGTGRHLYDVPYAAIEREPYEPKFTGGFENWYHAGGDWPALHWAGVDAGAFSVALLNRGTPSYRIERLEGGDVIFCSVLRSPILPQNLHEPESYTMTQWNGMRDPGTHRFEHAVVAYSGALSDSAVVLEGEAFNTVLPVVNGRVALPQLPIVQSTNIRAASLKWAESKDALILRLAEFRGRPGAARISVPGPFTRAEKTNLLERQGVPIPIADGALRIDLHPWEIATFKFFR